MESLFFLIFIIEIVIQIISIFKFKKIEYSKYHNIFTGITIASFISTILAFIVFLNNDVLDLGGAFLFAVICGFSFISNLILLLIVDLVLKKSIEKENVRLSINSILIGLLIILLNMTIIIVTPTMNDELRDNSISNSVITYLNKKYGDNSFEIINVAKNDSDIFGNHYTGYEVIATSPLLKNNFIIYTHGTDIRVVNDAAEGFIEEYYSEKINKYLPRKYDLKFAMFVKDENIPNTCGHIPTINELVDYNAINNIFMSANWNNYNYDSNENEVINYLKTISLDLINYLNISKDINIRFQISANKNLYNYDIQRLSNNLRIIDKNNKIYEFDIDK